MALPTLAEIFALPTQDEAFDQQVVPELQTRAVPVTAWAPGDVLRTMAYWAAKLWVQIQTVAAGILGGAIEEYAFGFTDPPAGVTVPEAWADVVGLGRYGVTRIAATQTRRNITLTNATANAYNAAAGTMMIQFTATGNRYVNRAAYVSAGSDIQIVSFESEYAYDSAAGLVYADASSTPIQIVTSRFPGVTATNPAGTFTDAATAGASLGTVVPTGTPIGLYVTSSWAVEILVSGQAAACTWRYQIKKSDGTLTAWATVVATAAVTPAGTGVTVTLTNHATVAPSFIAGDVFQFAAPGTDITVQGRDQETRQAYGLRCRGLIPLVAAAKDDAGNAIPVSPTLSGYYYLATTASDQVVTCLVQTDGTINNKVNVLVAGSGAPCSPSVIVTVQAFLDRFTMITDYPAVATTVKRQITLAGAVSVTVRAAQLQSAQQAMQSAIGAYLAGGDPNNVLGPNGTVQRDWLCYLIRGTAGVTGTNADQVLTINGAATDLTLPVTPGAFEQADWVTVPQLVSSIFTWVTV